MSIDLFASDTGDRDPLGNTMFADSVAFKVDPARKPISVLAVISVVSGTPTATVQATQANPDAGGQMPMSPFAGRVQGGWLATDGFCGGVGGIAKAVGTQAIAADSPGTDASIEVDLAPIIAGGAGADGETLIYSVNGIARTFTWQNAAPDPTLGQFNSAATLADCLSYRFADITSTVVAGTVVTYAGLDSTVTLAIAGTMVDLSGPYQTVPVVVANAPIVSLLTQFPSLEGEIMTISIKDHAGVVFQFGTGHIVTVADLVAAAAAIGLTAALVATFLTLTVAGPGFITVAAGPAAVTIGLTAGTSSAGPAGGNLFLGLPGVAGGDTIVLNDGTNNRTVTFGTGGGQVNTAAAADTALRALVFDVGVTASMDALGNLTFAAADGRNLSVIGTGGFADLFYIGIRNARSGALVNNPDCNNILVTVPIVLKYDADWTGIRAAKVSGGTVKVTFSQF